MVLYFWVISSRRNRNFTIRYHKAYISALFSDTDMTKIYFFDIEGTLTGIGGRGHSPKLLPALQKLMGKATVGLFTGRDASYAKAFHRLFDLNGPIIAESGCALLPDFARDETSYLNFGGFNDDQKRYIREKVGAAGILDAMYEDTEKRFMVTLYPNSFPNHSIDEVLRGFDRVKEVFAGDEDIVVTHSSAAVDLYPKGINKGIAIQKYCAEHGIPLSEVCVVGDSLNDLSAFETVGEGGGLIVVVDDHADLKSKLEKYDNVVYTKKNASEGVVEFVDSI